MTGWRVRRLLRVVASRQADVIERLHALRALKEMLLAEEARLLSEARRQGLTWKQIANATPEHNVTPDHTKGPALDHLS